ncbi:MAG: hypothetical protein Q8L73_05305 [Methylotenera sp.]|nr:hypothetical protein [Methylotenera sp.]
MMQKTTDLSYKALFGSIASLQSDQLPDIYVISPLTKSVKRPSSNFVISRNIKGEVVSCYGQNVWNLAPYRLVGDTSSAKILFNKLSSDSVANAKWLMFVLLFMVDTGRATGLSISTVLCYMKPIRQLEKYAVSNGISMFEVLGKEHHLLYFIRTLKTRNVLKGLMSLISHLHAIGSLRTGIAVARDVNVDKINKRLLLLGHDEQHPVIPPRILSEIVTQLNGFVETVYLQRHNLESFLHQIIIDERFARGLSQQQAIGYRVGEFAPFFKEAAEQFGLSVLFDQFAVRNMPNLSLFLTRMLHACRLMIHIYTGMRNSEALGLNVGCLKEEQVLGCVSFRIYGKTSKLVGQKKEVSWVTSKDTKKAVELAELLARIISGKAGLKSGDIPLFISTVYLEFLTTYKIQNKGITVSRTGAKSQEIYNYFDVSKFEIKVEDFNHLEKIDPFRAWASDNVFKVGATWRFTTHQFRRSLAYYVAQSALVSLPSLKRQLKHISREMTIYYCQAKDLPDTFDGSEHISHLIRSVKPEADALAYLNDVIFSEEPLWGAHGRFVDNHVKSVETTNLLTEQRDVLVKRFKKGELAYKVTPLGACTSTERCDKKAAREIVACISCDKAVLKFSKINNVIERQTQFVNECKDIDINSIEYRTELAELVALRQFKELMLRKDSLEI